MPTSKPMPIKSRLVDTSLIREIEKALAKIDGYGSVELYIQQNKVTQITARNIHKTQNPIEIHQTK